jgi:hypothetical protein
MSVDRQTGGQREIAAEMAAGEMAAGEVVGIVALVDGETVTQRAVVVHRSPYLVHIATDAPLSLPIGQVVGVVDLSEHELEPEGEPEHGSGRGRRRRTASLAVVSDSVGPTISELRVLERRN